MQSRIVCNMLNRGHFLTCFFLGLLVAPATVVIADGGMYQSSQQYSAQGKSEQGLNTRSRFDRYRKENPSPSQTNPWAVPAQPLSGQEKSAAKLQTPEMSCGQSDIVSSSGEQSGYGRMRMDRFVTPQILQTLKQQQTQTQMMPENRYYPPYGSQRQGGMQYGRGSYGQRDLNQSGYNQNYYNGPVYGAGSMNPLYEAPAVSPWGTGVDVLNRGESFPMVPREAVGGISPMYVPSYALGNYNDDRSYERMGSDDTKVFNPFTLLPDNTAP